MQTPLTFLAAFIVVLALIGLAAWLVRRFAGSNIGNNANRGRMPRLAVIDAAAVDGRRRLVLVRRDNVEHLLMIGGPTDVVVELNIVRAMPARDGAAPRPAVGDLPSRAPALPESPGWSESDTRPDNLDSVDSAGSRSQPSFADEVRRPVLPERRPEAMSGAEPASARSDMRVDPGLPRPPRPPRPDGMPRAPRLSDTLARLPRGPEPAPPPAAKPSSPDAEKELTDMAHRLEAALRRPSAPPVAPPTAAVEPAESMAAPAVEVSRPARPAPPPLQTPVETESVAPSGRSGFENLEDEMASLLGRPKSPT